MLKTIPKNWLFLALLPLLPACGFGLKKLIPGISGGSSDSESVSTSSSTNTSDNGTGGGSGGGGGGGGGSGSSSYFFFTANKDGSTVSRYSLDPSNAAVVTLGDYQNTAISGPTGLAATSNGNCLFIASEGNSTIESVKIDSTGELIHQQSYQPGFAPSDFAINSNDTSLYAYSRIEPKYAFYSVNAVDCLLEFKGQSSVNDQIAGMEVIESLTSVVISTDVNTMLFTIGSMGSLIPVSSVNTVGAAALLRRPSAEQIFVSIGVQTLAIFSVSTVSLNPIPGSPQSTNMISNMAFEKDGNYMYTAGTIQGSVSMRSVDAEGATTLISTIASGGTYPIAVAVDPTGKTLITANYQSNDVSTYLITHGGGGESAGISLVHNTSSGALPRDVVIVTK